MRETAPLTLELEQIRDEVLRLISESGVDEIKVESEAYQKELIRGRHSQQRLERGRKEIAAINGRLPRLLSHFADGRDIDPSAIKPYLELVTSESAHNDLFRLATLQWSVPVSRGYGRRMRYLVRDAQNDKLIGLFAIGDPVFNLRTRDEWIGWDIRQRTERLAHVMDAYIVGALPPYNQLLGGKLVTSLIGTEEVRRNFADKYRGRQGIISASLKPSDLALVTVTSALGRSSIYNRVRLDGMVDLERIGYTSGFGHFQVGDEAFALIRRALLLVEHKYANGHQYNQGPNWKMRAIRQGLTVLGIPSGILRHGIRREVFAMAYCQNARAFLRGEAEYSPTAATVDEVSQAALQRWILPRSKRKPEYAHWDSADTIRQLLQTASQLSLPLRFDPVS